MLALTKPIPALRWPVTAWLAAPVRPMPADVAAELRRNKFRRLEAILISAFINLIVAAGAMLLHPTPAFAAWLLAEILLTLVRVPLVMHIILWTRQVRQSRWPLARWAGDLLVASGTLWSATLGFGTMLCLSMNDPGLSVIASVVAMATVGAQCARNPGSSRLNSIQMSLIGVPFTIGLLLSKLPMLSWLALLMPFYLLGMISITRQLHEDYIEMIVARLENRRRALHCPLTNLPNRAFLDEALADALAAMRRPEESVAVLCLDLDGFKGVNDTLGHPVGDLLLVQVADRLRSALRPDLTAARLGGDEFAVVIRSCTVEGAETVAGRLVSAIGEPYHLADGHRVTIGVSIGIAVGGSNTDRGRLMVEADEALYASKRSGKGGFRRYGDEERRPEGLPALPTAPQSSVEEPSGAMAMVA